MDIQITPLTRREHIMAEAAMLIWEVVEPDYYPRDNSDPVEPFFSARDYGGIGQLRLDAREAAPYLDAAHELFIKIAGAPPGEFGIAYDFEFAPWFCETCLHPDFAGTGAAFGVYPGWAGLVTEYAREVRGKNDEEDLKRQARAACRYLWGVEPVVVELDLDEVIEGLTPGKDAARAIYEVVEAFGLDLDLSSLDSMERAKLRRRDYDVSWLFEAMQRGE